MRVDIAASSFFHKFFNFPTVKSSFTQEDIDGTRYLWIKTNAYNNRIFQIINQFLFSIKTFFILPGVVKRESYDLIVASSPHPFVVYAAKRCADTNDVPWIFEVRDLWPLIIQELSGASSNNPYIRLVAHAEKYGVNRSDAVVSVKPGDVDYFLSNYGLNPNRFNYIPSGFLPPTDAKEIMKVDHKAQFVVGYVGAVSAYYGITNLIEAAVKLADFASIKFRIVGGGDELENLRSLAFSYDLDNISFSGKISKQQVIEELEGFDACYVGLKNVKANWYGISCNKIFEYMHAAKPIIASYVSNYDPVQMAQCGITVPSGDPSELAHAILRLKEDPDLAKSLGMRGKEYFDRYHNFNKISDQYRDLFSELISIKKHT